jgi:hypothetical protein
MDTKFDEDNLLQPDILFVAVTRYDIIEENYINGAPDKYESQNRPVILLFFRLNGSNKVSVIYSTKLSIFRKTLRHHWFNRTYIEQFFKLLKHSMKIQNIIVRTKERFEQKLYQFMFIGFYLQKFTRYIRKQFDFRSNRNLGLEGLKRQKALRQVIIDLLGELLQTKNTVKDLLSSI